MLRKRRCAPLTSTVRVTMNKIKLKRKNKFYHVLATIIGAGMYVQLSLTEKGIINSSSFSYYLAPAFTVIMLFFSMQRFTKPLAQVKDNVLSIEGDSVEKDSVEYMKYEIESDRYHILTIKMNGFSEHRITLENQKKELDNLRLMKFIKDNFYPIEFIKNKYEN